MLNHIIPALTTTLLRSVFDRGLMGMGSGWDREIFNLKILAESYHNTTVAGVWKG